MLSMKDITLADLYKQKPKAKDEIEKAAGYAVFDASGVFVVLYVDVEGRGVMIDNSNGEATYMTMEGWDWTGCRLRTVPLRHRVQEQETR